MENLNLFLEQQLALLQRIERNQLLSKPVLTIEETATYTGMAVSYLYKLTSSRRIPHYRPNGKVIYFKREELDAWLLQNRIATKDEMYDKAQASLASKQSKNNNQYGK